MWVMIDDVRSANVDVIVRNAQAAIDCLHRLEGLIEVLLIDYDLGEPSSSYSVGVHKRKAKKSDKPRYGKPKMVDGYDVIMYAIMHELLPAVVQICSSNPEGRKRIADALIHDAKYVKKGVNYIKPEREEPDEQSVQKNSDGCMWL